MKKGILIKLLQFLLGGGIVFYLLHNIELHKINNLIHHAKIGYLFLAFLLLTLQIMIAAYRWLILLRLTGHSPPLWQCIGSSGMGNFVNAIVPGGIGGDITRTVITARRGVSTNNAAYSVILDRILTLAGLSLIIVMVLLGWRFWSKETIPDINMFALVGSLILLIGFIGLVFIAPLIEFIEFRIPKVFSLFIHLSKLLNTISHQKRRLISLSGVILISHLMLLIGIIVVAYSLQIPLSLKSIIIGLPIALFFSVFPITPGGWGIREGAMVLVLGQFQIIPEAALGISIIFGVLSTFSAFPIAMVWWFLRNGVNPSKVSVGVC